MMSIWMIRRVTRSFALLIAAAAAAAIVALPIGALVRTLRDVQPVHATAPPVSAIGWGDRVFWTPKPLAGWLHARGVSYRVWAHRHPPGNRLLRREARVHPR
jgi:hypothetical protein